MGSFDVWTVVHAERAALAADLRGLPDEAWSTPSLCGGWTVRDVLAHMTATAKVTPATFFPKLLGAGFSFTRLQAKDIAAESAGPPGQTLERFSAVADATTRPPGPKETPLGETLVHAQDIRRPLGIDHR